MSNHKNILLKIQGARGITIIYFNVARATPQFDNLKLAYLTRRHETLRNLREHNL